ncbi:hypothetical protein SLU01_12140 [Sporosarcina luteola]|uniref:ABC transporter permease n=1 Tax=Sporosarcina luteola TaxID=582850 RepID=A0A511Z647_9BACL|nr:hypothetical protein [Sporosarcina luteola]GEN82902.1 hypothetical protein SLU01_12140 [Sporosarcina luteola]
MFWKYLLFETKLLLQNRKNWLLGIALILFFPLYYSQYSQIDIKDMQKLKNEEAQHFHTVFYAFPEELRETAEGEAVYTNLTEQSSLINMQRFYLWKKEDYDKYIEDGIKLNELRLELHELGNKGIHPNYVIPKDVIQKEMAILRYNKVHKLPLVPDPFVASNYLPVALNMISGLLFCLFVLIIGSSMLLNDQQHRSVVGGFPISFMPKVSAKVAIHLVQVLLFLGLGVLIGGYYVAQKTEWGNFIAPVLIYQDMDFVAVSTIRYITYMFIAFALIALFLLLVFVLINVVTKNLYATILTMIVILLLPDLISVAGMKFNWLYPLKFIDISSVLSGEAALEFGNEKMDFKHSYSWLVGLNLIAAAILYGRNKLLYIRKGGSSILIASCLLILAGCHPMQKSDLVKVDPYEENFEVIGSEKDVLIGKVNPAIFNTADRSNENAEQVENEVFTQDGVKVTLQSGRYSISGSPVGNIFIYDKNGDLIIREIVGYAGGVGSLTVDIEDTYTVFADGGYDHVSFVPMPTQLSTDLNAGVWEVGLDIEAGEYTFGSEYGLGYLELHEEGKDPVLYEVIGGNEMGSKSRVELTEGQKIRITGISLVNFKPA